MSLPPELEFVFGKASTVYNRVPLVGREFIAENTIALTLQKPEGYAFESGQNAILSIPGRAADDLREFSFASAPHESSLVFAMRVRDSDFKHMLATLPIGSKLDIRRPAGALWTESRLPHIWLSGGIGITPFRSIMRTLAHENSSLDVAHIHSDKARGTTPFFEEFANMGLKHGRYGFHPTMTQENSTPLRGRITSKIILQVAPQYAQSFFTVVGTGSFIEAMRRELAELRIAPDRMRTERFCGYAPRI